MRTLTLRLVVISASAINSATAAEATALREVLEDASRLVHIYVLGDASSDFAPWRPSVSGPNSAGILRQLHGALGQRPEHTLAIGATRSDLSMADEASLYFHVGEEDVLDQQVRRVVPLWGQYAVGTMNALAYFVRCGFSDAAIQHADIPDFVGRSIRFYESRDAAATSLEDHRAFSASLVSEFGTEIVGIFATGFPFYCSPSELRQGTAATPPSILAYLTVQENYFASKLIGHREFRQFEAELFDRGTAEAELGLRLDRNQFDVYEYESRGTSPPAVSHRATLRQLFAETALDIAEDPWPCGYCVPLQAPDLFPRQQVLKDTNETCLRCRQTTLMLRNVSGCCVDMDIVVAAARDARGTATRIKRYINERSATYLYDLELRRTVLNYNDGPVDIFVTTATDLAPALQAMSTPTWLTTEFPAVALWSLTLVDHRFNLGEDFPVAFDPQMPLRADLRDAFSSAREGFAIANTDHDVVEALRSHSLARRQLMGNPDIVAALAERLRHWRAGDTQVNPLP